MSLINDEIDSKQILETFSDKIAKSKHFKDTVEFRQQVQDKLNREITDLFKKENVDKATDTVVLSGNAAVFKKDEIKQKVSLDRVDAAPFPGEDETVLERVEKRLSAATREPTTMTTGQANPAAQTHESLPRDRIQETLRQYVGAYSEGLIMQSPSKKKEVMELREKLQFMGVSSKQIAASESRVATFIRSDLRERIKKGFIQFALTYTEKFTPEMLQANDQYKALEEMGLGTGVFRSDSEVAALKEEAKKEMGSFVADELDNTLIRERVSGGSVSKLVAAFNQFNELASVIKFDSGQYMRELSRKMDNLGLNRFVAPEAPRGQMDTDSRGGGGKRGQQSDPELNVKSLPDELRRLIVLRAVRSDFFGIIDVRVKISRVRSKLKRFGEMTDSEIAEIEREGEALARMRFIDMVSEALE
ncbi:hypothetical protein EBR96_10035, partial [bacterium]|nr:hypothetical protein [bacterium]